MFPTLFVSILTAFPVSVFCTSISVTPSEGNFYQGTTASFGVVGSGIASIDWTLNNSSLTTFPDLITSVSVPSAQFRQLDIVNVSTQYNNAVVGCTVTVTGGTESIVCDTAVLRLQGILDPVLELAGQYNVIDSSVNISWLPPPALAVFPAAMPERFYCVEVINQTSPSMSVIDSIGCDQTTNQSDETSFLLTNVVCGTNYAITVTSFNRIGDGGQSTVLFPDAVDVMDSTSPPQVNGTKFTYIYPVSGQVCNCAAEEDVEGSLSCLSNTPERGFITVTTMGIALDLDFTATISMQNSRMQSSEVVDITTFDTYELNITYSNSEVEYSIVFVGGSNALGVLMIFLFRANGLIDFSRSVYFVQGRLGAQTINKISGISGGTYVASAYDVDEDGEITSHLAAEEEEITLTRQHSDTLSLSPFGVDINCTINVTRDQGAVEVWCEYDTTVYNGFRTYLQNTQNSKLTFSSSNESGSSVVINGSVDGEHYVFVYPIWKPGSILSDDRMEPAHDAIYNLTGLLRIATATSPDTSTNVLQSMSPSFYPSPASSTVQITDFTGSLTSSVGSIIGVAVAGILVTIMTATLILLMLIFILKKRKKNTAPIEYKYTEEEDILATTANECYGLTSVTSVNPQDPVYTEVMPPTSGSVDVIRKAKDDDLHISANEYYNIKGQGTATNDPDYINVHNTPVKDIHNATNSVNNNQSILQQELMQLCPDKVAENELQ